MSTPANIIFLDESTEIKTNKNQTINKKCLNKILSNETAIYIHSDGGQILSDWLEDFLKLYAAAERKHSKEYLTSWAITYFNTVSMAKYIIAYNREKEENLEDHLKNYEFKTDDFKKMKMFIGSGIAPGNIFYYEYLYLIKPLQTGNYFKVDQTQPNFKVYCIDWSNEIIKTVEI